jgi:hypothetical protein
MTIPVIVLSFRSFEDNDYEYPSLQQRMYDEYVHAFAPHLLRFRQMQNSATPISSLVKDFIQIKLLYCNHTVHSRDRPS